MTDDTHHRLFAAVFGDDSAAVRRILKNRPDLLDAWIAGADGSGSEFTGQAFDSRGCDGPPGLDPLGYAVALNSPSTVEVLIELGADIESLNHEGNMGWCTPLTLAAFAGAKEMVDILARQGANPNVKSSAGQSPLLTAAEHGQADIADMLLQSGAKMTIHAAAAMGLVDEINRLLDESDAWLEARDSYRQASALFFAAGADQGDVIRVLVARGASMDLTDIMQWTPLLRAGYEARNDAALALIELGAEVNFVAPTDRWGLPAGSNVLHALCCREEAEVEVVRALLEHGVDATRQDSRGRRPVDVATEHFLSALVEALG